MSSCVTGIFIRMRGLLQNKAASKGSESQMLSLKQLTGTLSSIPDPRIKDDILNHSRSRGSSWNNGNKRVPASKGITLEILRKSHCVSHKENIFI